MSALMEAGTQLAPRREASIPIHLRSVIERHLDGLVGLPSKELVVAICNEVVSPSHKEEVVHFFMLQSPLRVRDLMGACAGISPNRLAFLCRNTAALRGRKLKEGWKPLWEEAQTS